jgi:hypothetical protein
VATQESTQIRKYVTNSDSILSDSAALGNEQLQPALEGAGGDPQRLDIETVSRVAEQSRDLYRQALANSDVPAEFEEAHHYMVSSLGVRAATTARLAEASGDTGGFAEALSAAVEDYGASDILVREHYLPATLAALDETERRGSDEEFVYEPEPFMDYGALGFDAASAAGAQGANDPNALHGVEISSVEIAGQLLYPGGNVTLTGSDELVFAVTVFNGGEVPETNVPVEVILNTSAERQSQTAAIERIEPGGTAAAQVTGFRPGELNEVAQITVEAGPVRYEDNVENNTLGGTVTFGI